MNHISFIFTLAAKSRLAYLKLIVIAQLMLLFGCSPKDDKVFTALSSRTTHIDFNNRLVEDAELNVLNYTYFYNGGGVAAGDINNDGLTDLVFTGNMVKNRLYLNKGNFEFEDITEQSGIAALEGWCTGVTMADVNADGWLDIYICRSADIEPARRQNLLFINNKNNSFTEAAAQYGINDAGYSTQGSFFDYDRDNDLDLIVINHSLQKYTSGVQENPALRTQSNPDFATRLYRNDGIKFTNVTDSAGIISNVLSFGLGVAVSDLNNDQWPDIYISNDFNEQDYCFINNQDGTFREMSKSMFRQMSLYSMGSDAADLNNDGFTDLVTLDMLPEGNYLQKMHSGAENFDKFQVLFWNGFHYQYSRNMLQLNNGNGTFSETGQLAGISNTDWSWAALATDFDNDGWKDIFITNGYVKDYTDMDFLKYSADKAQQGAANTDKAALMADVLSKMPTIKLANYLFHNKGAAQFENKAIEWGLEQQLVSAGAAYADFDNDGDMDLVVNNSNDNALVYRNNTSKPNTTNYLQLKLKGRGKNTQAIGAVAAVWQQNGTFQKAELVPTRGFQSAAEPLLHFGLGDDSNTVRLQINWPDGTISYLENVSINQRLVIDQNQTPAIPGPELNKFDSLPLLKQTDLPFTHRENSFNDFTRQALLPTWFSRQGPALAVGDINGDKRIDAFIGGAAGKGGVLLLQQTGGNFIVQTQTAFAADSSYEDVTAVFLDADGDGDNDLIVASGGYEMEDAALLQNRIYFNDGRGNFSKQNEALPADVINDNAIAVADFDGDGDTDIFNGGHCVPGRFPQSSGAQLLLNNGKGKFERAGGPWFGRGLSNKLITSAAAADFNGDGKTDLAIAGHWMGVELWLNKGNGFENASNTWQLLNLSGLYNSLTVADLNKDGRPDLVAGNQGLNNQFKASASQPMQLYYSDFDGNGIAEPIMTYYIDGQPWLAYSRDDLAQQIPMVNKKFLFYADYAKASPEAVLGKDKLAQAMVYSISNLSSMVLENTGATFKVHQLPAQVQWAPAYATTTMDIDGDGLYDLIGGGNQTYTRIRYGRFDASYGWVLRNKGNFQFEYLPPRLSGLSIKGDVRQMLATENKIIAAINDGTAQLIKRK